VKLAPRTPLDVALEFAPDRVVPVGRLALERGVGVLEYAPQLIASRLSINPLFEPPGRALVRAADPRTFGGLHGVFADSLPDAWGELLLRRRAAANGVDYVSLTVLDKLAAVGRRGMGALTYEPAFLADGDAPVDLDLLASEASAVLDGRDSDVIAQLERLGGSSGGARPKVLVAMDDGGRVVAGIDRVPAGFAAWLVKFRSSADLRDIGPLEAAYATMARAAGLDISDTKLIAAARGPGYFATKRFDRTSGNGRRHMLSVASLLDADWRVPSLDYADLIKTVRAVTRHEADVERMFRRMVFNVAAHNRDDHTKQHAFIMDESGRWTLAPPYDLTFSAGPGGEHYLSVNGSGTDVSRAAVDAVAKRAAVASAAARAIVDEVTDAVSRFKSFARAHGVSRRTVAEVRKVIDQDLATLGRT
jgi:serine/threonine-protein kinase HipA